MLQGGAILDLLVVGGGIHGVAVARDAALRGLDVLLAEQGDLAGATSSRTSKLIHGGIRYLEHGEWSLVREALHERALLLRIAPEFVRPLTFLLPLYRGSGRPRWMLEIGLALYGALAGEDPLAAHRRLNSRALREAESSLEPDGLTGGFLFHDAQMDDALLCVATALAAEAAGADVRTYTRVERLERTVAGWRAHLVDRDRGVEEAVEARWIVNAAGPWVDDVRRSARGGTADTALRRTRGTHVVLEGPLVAHALLLTARRDGRVFFILPWGTHTVIGTTDVDDDREPAAVGPVVDDVRYLMEEAGRAVPGVRGARMVRAFAGVRPLAGNGGGGAASRAPSSNRREHKIIVEDRLVSIVGGKYTTHRSLAAGVVDQVLSFSGRRAGPSLTATPLGASREEAIQALARSHPRTLDLPGGLRIREAEVAHAVRAEKARHVDDVLLRRTRLWLDGRALRDAAAPVSEWMGIIRGWNEATRRAEVERFTRSMEGEARTLEEAAR